MLARFGDLHNRFSLRPRGLNLRSPSTAYGSGKRYFLDPFRPEGTAKHFRIIGACRHDPNYLSDRLVLSKGCKASLNELLRPHIQGQSSIIHPDRLFYEEQSITTRNDRHIGILLQRSSYGRGTLLIEISVVTFKGRRSMDSLIFFLFRARQATNPAARSSGRSSSTRAARQVNGPAFLFFS